MDEISSQPMESRVRSMKNNVILFLFLFFFSLFPSVSYSNLTFSCDKKELISIKAENTDIHKLFFQLSKEFNIEILNTEIIENLPITISLFDLTLEDLIKKIIHIAKIKNYSIIYNRKGLSTPYFVTKIIFFSDEFNKDEIIIRNYDGNQIKNLKLDEIEFLPFLLNSLTDEDPSLREEALENIGQILDLDKGKVFIDSLKHFIKNMNDENEENKKFDREIVKRIAMDMLEEFYEGIQKETYGR